MRKSLVWRAFWMGVVVLLFTAGLASGQEQDQPSQDQPSSDAPAAADAASPDATAEADTVDLSNAMSMSDAINADLYNASSPYTGLPALGSPPTQLPLSGGLRFGPFYLTGVSDFAYYSVVSNSQGQIQAGNYGSFWGNNLVSGIGLSHKVGENGTLAFHATPQLLTAGSQVWFNQTSGLTFTDNLTDRWTLYANTQLAYFQNSVLTNPQYALVNTSGGTVVQTIYAQTNHPAFYQFANVGATYALGSKTTLSLSPTLGFSVSNQSGPWSYAHQFGGTVAVAHQYSEKGSVSVFYGFTHSTTSFTGSGTTGTNSWNGSNFGVGISQGLGGETWSIAFNVAASSQRVPSLVWTAVGNVALIKKLNDGTISANYSRSQAALLLLSSGYFDQANITYTRNFGLKAGMNLGTGAYRSNYTVSGAHGVRVSGSVFYHWLPGLVTSAGFFYGQQGGDGSQLYLFHGTSRGFNFGLTWIPGSQSQQ